MTHAETGHGRHGPGVRRQLMRQIPPRGSDMATEEQLLRIQQIGEQARNLDKLLQQAYVQNAEPDATTLVDYDLELAEVQASTIVRALKKLRSQS